MHGFMSDVVQISLVVVDQTKVDGKNIMAVVVEILKNGQIRCAHASGVLNHPYSKHSITALQGIGNNMELCGLEDIFLGW